MFSAETYILRRKNLCEKISSGLILLLGNDESAMNYADNCYHYRQDSTFLYYFGINFPRLAALIDTDSNTQIIFGNNYTIDDIVWMGSQPTIMERAMYSGVKNVLQTCKLPEILKNAQRSGRKIHFLPAYRPEHTLKISEFLGITPAKVSLSHSIELVKAVVSQREIKSEEEIQEIEKGVDLSVDMHIAAMKTARPGITEAQIAARVYEIAHAADCEISFPIIATINGQTLHNHYHGNTLKIGDLFLLDAGAEVQSHYAGDLSSTFPVDKAFTSQQKIIYQMSLKTHQAAIEALQLNEPYKNVHLAACRSTAESMKELGLLKGDIEEIVQAGAHALFFPHGVGHMLGLDVHDMENLGETWVGYNGEEKSSQFGLKSLRLAKPLLPGHVFTIEPGIYFIPELMDKWQAENKYNDFINWNEVQKFRNFGGIRNEENYMMTADGARRLGNKVKPKTIEEVENIKQSI